MPSEATGRVHELAGRAQVIIPTHFYITHAIAILVLAAVNLLVLYLWWRCRRWVAVLLVCVGTLAGLWGWFTTDYAERITPQGIMLGPERPPGFAGILRGVFAFLRGAAAPSALFGVFLLPRSAKRRDSDRCEKCGYLLYGLPENRCPECATPFEPPDNKQGTAQTGEREPLVRASSDHHN